MDKTGYFNILYNMPPDANMTIEELAKYLSDMYDKCKSVDARLVKIDYMSKINTIDYLPS